MPPEEMRRGDSWESRPDTNNNSTIDRVSPRRCAALKLDGEPCQAWPAADGWPFCSSYRWLHRHLALVDGTWGTAHAAARAWIRDVGRPRWPDFGCNDELWAVSIATWATSGRRSAA